MSQSGEPSADDVAFLAELIDPDAFQKISDFVTTAEDRQLAALLKLHQVRRAREMAEKILAAGFRRVIPA